MDREKKPPNWRWYNKLDINKRKLVKGVYTMSRRKFDRNFKLAAVKLAQEADKSVTQTAIEIGISGSSLRRWINEYDEYGESAFPGHGNALFNSTYEIKKLQKQVKELEMENEILKKLQAFLKKKNA